MKKTLTAQTSITINAPSAKVWKAITTPKLVKRYLMGTDVETDWKEGSDISYSGEYNGKKYHDKGKIKKIEKGKIFQSTYWSSMSGKEDKPENYNLITYELSPKEDKTVVTLSQDNNADEKEKDASVENWKKVLKELKKVAESEA